MSDVISRWLAWLTQSSHNLRSFAVLRILYGAGLLITLVPSIPERSLLWGPASFWVDPEASRRGYFWFDTLLTKSDALLFDLGFFATIVIVLLFTIGLWTRVMTVLTLVMIVCLQANNPYVLNGGDTLYRITLVFLVFANLGAYFSVDAWLRNRRRRTRRPLIPAFLTNAAHNTALVLCCFQIVIVYTVSGIWKLTGDDWLGGKALFYALRLDTFMVYPAFNELLWQSSLLIYIATFIALWVQSLFPLAILWRPTRIFVLVALIFMHSGIGILLGLWPFSLAMIALDMLFIRDSTWESVLAWFSRTRVGERVRDLAARLPRAPRKRPARPAAKTDTEAAPAEQAPAPEPTPAQVATRRSRAAAQPEAAPAG